MLAYNDHLFRNISKRRNLYPQRRWSDLWGLNIHSRAKLLQTKLIVFPLGLLGWKACSVGNGVASFIRPCISFLLFTVFLLCSIHQISDDARRRFSEHLWIMFARASPGDPMPLFLLPHESCTRSKWRSLYSATNNLMNEVSWKIKRISTDRIPRFNPLTQKQE